LLPSGAVNGNEKRSEDRFVRKPDNSPGANTSAAPGSKGSSGVHLARAWKYYFFFFAAFLAFFTVFFAVFFFALLAITSS
jgi:hypothetical protein